MGGQHIRPDLLGTTASSTVSVEFGMLCGLIEVASRGFSGKDGQSLTSSTCISWSFSLIKGLNWGKCLLDTLHHFGIKCMHNVDLLE